MFKTIMSATFQGISSQVWIQGTTLDIKYIIYMELLKFKLMAYFAYFLNFMVRLQCRKGFKNIIVSIYFIQDFSVHIF